MAGMSQHTVPCVDCGEPTDPKGLGNFYESKGWIEYRGKAGGANNLRWKEATGRILCRPCAVARQTGTKDQGSLF